jgi:zinc transporter 1/2/3
MAGLIAMISVLVVVSIEQFFAMRGAGHVHSSDFDKYGADEDDVDAYHDHTNGTLESGRARGGSIKRLRGPPHIMLGEMQSSTENLIAGRSPSVGQPSPLPPNLPSAPRKSIDSADDDLDLDLDELNTNAGLLNGKAKHIPSDDHSSSDDTTLNGSGGSGPSNLHQPTHPDHVTNQKALLQCLLLEAGILFHSIFIGMALSVSTGPPFAVLLLAISFHQTFEGLALGSRISALVFPPGSIKPWLMALAYGTTTPVGQAIGLAIHGLYDPASETGLLTVGVMNAISSGLLLFAGLVELLAEDFLSEASYSTLRGRRRVQACGSVVAGATLMALVGAWA